MQDELEYCRTSRRGNLGRARVHEKSAYFRTSASIIGRARVHGKSAYFWTSASIKGRAEGGGLQGEQKRAQGRAQRMKDQQERFYDRGTWIHQTIFCLRFWCHIGSSIIGLWKISNGSVADYRILGHSLMHRNFQRRNFFKEVNFLIL